MLLDEKEQLESELLLARQRTDDAADILVRKPLLVHFCRFLILVPNRLKMNSSNPIGTTSHRWPTNWPLEPSALRFCAANRKPRSVCWPPLKPNWKRLICVMQSCCKRSRCYRTPTTVCRLPLKASEPSVTHCAKQIGYLWWKINNWGQCRDVYCSISIYELCLLRRNTCKMHVTCCIHKILNSHKSLFQYTSICKNILVE